MISKTTVKFIKSLQIKKLRQKYEQFLVEGEKSIAELLKSHFEVIKILATKQWIEENRVIMHQFDIEEISEKELLEISSHQSPQKVLAIVKIPNQIAEINSKQLVLGLDEIQDPGNLGTIIRIADWYGISQIICSKGCTDVYNPKCINATMGSFLRVKVAYQDLLQTAQNNQLPIIVATLEGNSIHGAKMPQNGLLIVGNEGHGIDPEIIKNADYNYFIPRFGKAESLNAAISIAIILDNFKRQ